MSDALGQALCRALDSKALEHEETRDAYVGVLEWLDRLLGSLGVTPTEATRAELAQALALRHRRVPPSRPGLVPAWGLECITGELVALLPGATGTIVMGPERSHFFLCRAMRIVATNHHDPMERRHILIRSVNINQEVQFYAPLASLTASMFGSEPGTAVGIRFTRPVGMVALGQGLMLEFSHHHDVAVDTRVEIYGDPLDYMPPFSEFPEALAWPPR